MVRHFLGGNGAGERPPPLTKKSRAGIWAIYKYEYKDMKPRQPKVIKISTTKWDDRLEKYPKGNLKCKLQEREEGEESTIVYVENPFYKKGTTDLLTQSQLIAITKSSYEVVEWYEGDTKG